MCAAWMTSARAVGCERNGECEESNSTTVVGWAEIASVSRTMRRCYLGGIAVSLAQTT
jgi:hypothetical protein